LMPLGTDEQAEVEALYAVINDPMHIMTEMESGTLTPSQAEAFAAIYPALHEHLRMALARAAANKAIADPAWMPTETQEIVLGVLTGRPPGVLSYEAPAPPQNAPDMKKDLGAEDAATQADKTTKPTSAKK